MRHVDLLIHSAEQLAICHGRGAPSEALGLIASGALAIADGVVVAAGPSNALREVYAGAREIDATRRVVCPGFVDPHTHLVYAGDRVDEFERKLGGAGYLEILAAGGGILSTMRATRAADVETLAVLARGRLARMLALGTTTVECKTGYGLSLEAELKQLAAAAMLQDTQPVDLAPTLLAAHALPPEYTGRGDDYVRLVCDTIIPSAAEWHARSPFAARTLFVDVFCEKAAFDAPQSAAVLAAGRAHGLAVKAHVDQFNEIGGLGAALALGAVSVDHLDATGPAGVAQIAANRAVPVLIPTVPFHLGAGAGGRYADARAMLDAGCPVALCTDLNPGSAPCYSMQFVIALACRFMRMSAAEALLGATIHAARAISREDRVGSLEPGKQADVLILDAPDYRHLAYQFGGNLVTSVIKHGQAVI